MVSGISLLSMKMYQPHRTNIVQQFRRDQEIKKCIPKRPLSPWDFLFHWLKKEMLAGRRYDYRSSLGSAENQCLQGLYQGQTTLRLDVKGISDAFLLRSNILKDWYMKFAVIF